MAHGGDIVLTYDTGWLEKWSSCFDDPLEDAETFRLDGDERAIKIGNRPQGLAQAEGQYMGLLSFTPRGLESIEAHLATLPGRVRDVLDMTALLSALIEKDVAVRGIPFDGIWGEVDPPRD